MPKNTWNVNSLGDSKMNREDDGSDWDGTKFKIHKHSNQNSYRVSLFPFK